MGNSFNSSKRNNVCFINKVLRKEYELKLAMKKEREEKLEESINKLIKLIDNHLQNSNQLSKEEISFLYFIKCLSLDKLPKYSKESEDSVNKSVSLKNSHIIRINYFSSSN